MHIELGKMQELMVVKKVDFGVYLAPEDNQEEKVLLPGKQVPEGCETGDFVTVFIYRDSKDRLIATRKEPKLSLGEVAVLTVAQTGKFGAFLDSVSYTHLPNRVRPVKIKSCLFKYF